VNYFQNISRLLFILVLFTSAHVFAEFTKEYHKTFKVEEGTKLHLRHGDGDVRVEPWDKNELQVDVFYRAAGDQEDEKLFRVEFDQRDNKIYIVGKEFRGSWTGDGRRTYEYRFAIKAPAYILMDLEGDDGDVNVTGWRNDLMINLSDGNVDLEDIKAGIVEIDLEDGDLTIRRFEGELSVSCEDGDVILEEISSTFSDIGNQDGTVKIRNARGKFRIRTEDGNCRISGMKAEELDIRAQDGNVDIQIVDEVSPRIKASCQDGNIDLEIPAGTDAELQINARRGSIRTNLDNPRIEMDEKDNFRAILGSGKGSIDLSASDGRVTVRQ